MNNDYRVKRLLKEIEVLLHASNEDVLLANRYRNAIVYKIKLVHRYRSEVK